MTTRLYLSGPMSGLPDHNFPAFNEAETRLLTAGYDVVNPADKGIIDGWEWADYLRHDIALLLGCDGVAVLPGWRSSKGAQLEVHIARKLSMDVAYFDRWVLQAELDEYRLSV